MGTAALVVVAAGVVTGGAPIVLLAGVGLGAAAGVDLVERRIPTPIAHGTTIVSGIVVTVSLLSEGNQRGLVTLWLSTATVVTIYVVLWLAGGVGFGDVRLAAATVSAAGAGLGYVAAMVTVPLLVLPVLAIGWRLAGRPPPVPYGPALVAGWLVALSGLSS
jgi:prepilin signal peptidase PulO-like enzyme (type II secretory pathway)